MKSSILFFVLMGFVAAIPLERSPIAYTPNLSSSTYGYPGNVAEYIAYQFSQAQKAGYTPSQVAEYLLTKGYPEYVAMYLAQEYAAGLSKPYFQSPYEMFRYFYQQGVTDNVREYIGQQIAKAYQQYLNGEQIYGQEYQNVPVPFSQYVIQQRNYYNQYEKIFSNAEYSYQQLQLAEQYVQQALQFLTAGQYQQNEFQYVYQKLIQGLGFIRKAQEVYQTYQTYQEKYVPYYVVQYYSQQADLAYQYFLQAYNYVQEKQIELPQYFVQLIQLARVSVQKAYQTYQPNLFSDVYQYRTYGPSSQMYGYTPFSASYGNYGTYGPYSGSYISSNYETYGKGYGYYGPYSSSYTYGTYVPYSSSYYNYGSFGPYSQSYGYQYGPYSTSYVQDSSYAPSYLYGSNVAPTYKTWQGVDQSYGYGYPYRYGYSSTYAQIAAAAA